MNPVTLWYTKRKSGLWFYNHYEDGHTSNDQPTPKSEDQQVWSGQEWKKEFAHMKDGVIMKDKIYYLKDCTEDNRLKWVQSLNASGFAGIRKGDGMLCDRREFPNAIPVQENRMFGVVVPKKLPK